jgi:hypothetical protein
MMEIKRDDLVGQGAKTEPSKKYPDLTGWFESKNVEGMFFAGTVAHGLDWRKAAGGFIHGFRYTAQALNSVLEHKIHQTPWPSTTISLMPSPGSDAETRMLSAVQPLIELVRSRINSVRFNEVYASIS